MTVLFALAVLEVIGFLLVRTHPEVRDMYRGGTLHEKIKADLALLGLWPLLALALCDVGGTR